MLDRTIKSKNRVCKVRRVKKSLVITLILVLPDNALWLDSAKIENNLSTTFTSRT